MLQRLLIKNYAIIEEVDINFKDGLTVITGETGAGKSIIIGALSLILGERADTSVLLNKEEKSIVEAQFKLSKKSKVNDYLDHQGFDQDESLIVRRELSSSGRSRAFINDTPAKLSQLSELSLYLADLHRQFDNLELQLPEKQLNLLDVFCQHEKSLNIYKETYFKFKKNRELLSAKEEEAKTRKEGLDYNQFLLSEIQSLSLEKNEIESLQKRLELMQAASQNKETLMKSYQLLSEGDQSIVDQLSSLSQNFKKVQGHAFDTLHDRLNSCKIELEDIASEIHQLFESSDINQDELRKIQDRFDEACRLLQKHRLQSTHELLALSNSLSISINEVESNELEIAALLKTQQALEKKLKKEANALHAHRQKKAKVFERKVSELLHEVGMPDAVLKLEIAQIPYNEKGTDAIQFLFDANNVNNFQALHKVASGGELSRLHLCVKCIIAGLSDLPTLIFDEIDAGISGDTAKKVGARMNELAQKHQLISITHLPQIAAKAQEHLFVYKKKGKQTFNTSSIKRLNNKERVEALAIMLSGNEPSETARQTALELMLTD